MKVYKSVAQYALLLLITGLGLQSCLSGADRQIPMEDLTPNGVVTVKKTTGDAPVVYLQLDEKTTLLPVNIKKHPFDGKEVRALLRFKEVEAPHEGYTKAVHVAWIDSITTKSPVPNTQDNDAKYGRDVLEVVQDQVTGIEDGYLTLRVRVFVNRSRVHTINLVQGTNPKDPYEFEVRHDAHGDTRGGRVADGYVSFRLNDLPPTETGKPAKLTLRWSGTTGVKTHTYEYAFPRK